jgi:uncharacterized protein (TIGR03437 family)
MNRLTSMAVTVLLILCATTSLPADPIGQILVCYACQNSGDAAIDAALAANPDVAADAILFAFKNTSSFAITGGVLSVKGTTPSDSFVLPTIPAGAEFILIPGITSDGANHPSGGLFELIGPMDTSEGAGGVDDTSIFQFTGIANGLAVTSVTAGTNPPDGTFTPGDPGLIMPWRSPAGGKTSFVGDGPDGDADCTNCYFGVVASLNTSASATGSFVQVSPLQLSFSAVAGGGTPAPQQINVLPASATQVPATFRVVVDAGSANTPAPPWLTVNPANANAPASLTATVSQGSMPAGNSAARVRIVDTNGTPTDVSVTLALTSAPAQLHVSPGSLSFKARSLASGVLTQTLSVTNSGGNGPLTFSTQVLAGSSWITSVSPNSGSTTPNSPVLIQVTVNPQGLAADFYSDTIRLKTSAGNIDVPVSLFVASSGPILGLNVTGLRFQARPGGGYSKTQAVQILNIGDPGLTVNWSATFVSGANLFSLGASSGTATSSNPATLTITPTAAALQLSPGGYDALIRISDPQSLNSPQYVSAVLDLQSSASPALPDPSPAGLFFRVTAGGAQSSSQIVTVNTSTATPAAFQVAPTTSDGSNWLIVNPLSGNSTGQSAGTLNVSVNPSALAAGIYTGAISVSMSGALRTVNVTAIVLPPGSTAAQQTGKFAAPLQSAACSPTKLALVETALANNFATPAKWPATLIVQLYDDCANAILGGAVVASFSNGDASLSLLGDGQNGTYSATWQPGAVTDQMVVTFTATAGTLQPATAQLIGGVGANPTPVPSLALNGTLNNLNPVVGDPLAPGTIAQVYGSGLAATSGSPNVLPLPKLFNGTFAVVGPYQVPLYFLSDGQLNIQIPTELAGTQQYPIVVSVNNSLSVPNTISTVAAAPGVLSYLDGAAPTVQDGAHALAQHSTDFSLVNSTNPAKPGEFITIYLVGMGTTNPSVSSGAPAPSSEPLARVVLQPTVTVDGHVVDTNYAGLTPGFAGLYQITFQMPSSLSSNQVDLLVTQKGRSANPTKLPAAP